LRHAPCAARSTRCLQHTQLHVRPSAMLTCLHCSLRDCLRLATSMSVAKRLPVVQVGIEVAKDVQAFEVEEAARHAREHAKVMHFKALQEVQVAEKEARVRQARMLPAHLRP
jgi:hypothetical protein